MLPIFFVPTIKNRNRWWCHDIPVAFSLDNGREAAPKDQGFCWWKSDVDFPSDLGGPSGSQIQVPTSSYHHGQHLFRYVERQGYRGKLRKRAWRKNVSCVFRNSKSGIVFNFLDATSSVLFRSLINPSHSSATLYSKLAAEMNVLCSQVAGDRTGPRNWNCCFLSLWYVSGHVLLQLHLKCHPDESQVG